VEAKEQNYGTFKETEVHEAQGPTGAVREAPAPGAAIGAGTVDAGTERTWSAIAHLSAFLNIFTIFLGPVAALGVWLYYRDRSEAVAFQALQSAAYQGAWLLALAAGWGIAGLLTIVLVGFLLFPVMAILTVVPFVHAGYAAYKTSKGVDYRYPIVADLIERR